MWWKIAIGFVSGLVAGGVYVGIVSNMAEQDLMEKMIKEAYDQGFIKGVGTYKEFINAQQ